MLIDWIWLLPLAGAWLVFPVLARRSFGLDHPDPRKIHVRSVSRLGGVGIFALTAGTVALAHALGTPVLADLPVARALVAGTVLSFVTGLWDDLFVTGSKLKLGMQVFAATVAYALGFRLEHIDLGPGYGFALADFSYPVTVFWIVGVMNAVNLIDGMDGLCGGVSAITFLVIALFAHFFQNGPLLLLCAVCAATCAGFVAFNFHPARLFMGDSGSMTLGFLLATFPMLIDPSRIGGLPIYIPLLLLVFPLLDTTVAIVRRMIRSMQIEAVPVRGGHTRWLRALKTVLIADGDHIHHRLLKKGLGQRRVAVLLYALSLCGSLIGFLMLHLPAPFSWIVGVSTLYGVYQLILSLDYLEFASPKAKHHSRLMEEDQMLRPRSKLLRKTG